MNGKRSLSSAVAVLTIPLLLCFPQAFAAAVNIYDYIPSRSLLSGGWRSGGSLERRTEVPGTGYYNPLDYGGSMLTVSSPHFYLLSLLWWAAIGALSRTPVTSWDDVKSDG